MPKMKTKRGAAKRLKGPKRRRHLRQGKVVSTADERRLRVLVPYL